MLPGFNSKFAIRNPESAARRRGGFTLLEILFAMIIISILAAAALPVLHRARNRACIVKTKATIASLEAALSMYQTDMGDYPEWDGEKCRILVESLMGPMPEENWKGPYMRFREADLDDGRNVLDTWKIPVSYKYPQDEKPNVPFILHSAGPDRKMNTKDDIGNW